MSRRSKKKTSVGGIFAKTLLLVIAVGIVFLGIKYYTMSNSESGVSVTQTINRKITKKAVDEIVSQATDGEYSLSEIEENMDEQDQETLDNIIDKYADNGMITDAIETLTDNGVDVTETVDELKEKIDSSDIETLMELYEKYGNN